MHRAQSEIVKCLASSMLVIDRYLILSSNKGSLVPNEIYFSNFTTKVGKKFTFKINEIKKSLPLNQSIKMIRTAINFMIVLLMGHHNQLFVIADDNQ